MLHIIFLLAATAGVGVPAVVGLPMLNTELERGIAMANVAATAESIFYEEAEEVYTQARDILPRIKGLTRDDHSALETKMSDLRMALQIVPGATSKLLQPAPKVYVLPRANLG